MFPPSDPSFVSLIAIIEFVGAMIIVGYVVYAALALLRRRSIADARLLVAEGVLLSLSFKLAATLLKTIEIRSWRQILMFAAILALRTLLKTLFKWERKRVQLTRL